MPLPTASGRISGEQYKRGSGNFIRLSEIASLINLSDTMSLAASGRLQNAIKYCTKVRKMGAAGTQAHNSVTVWRTITSDETMNLTECLPRL